MAANLSKDLELVKNMERTVMAELRSLELMSSRRQRALAAS
jgi:hypothetical protein